jgi:flavin-binding protein dodecin
MTPARREKHMAESVYKVITLVGTSTESWEKAANAALTMAKHSLRDLRVGRVIEQDVHVEEGQPLTYRIKLEVSFKYEGGS